MTRGILQTLWFFLPAYLANMAPVVARGHFELLDQPLDGGRMWRGTRIFGAHKTWRGLVVGVVVGVLTVWLQRAVFEMGWLRELAAIDYDDTTIALPVGFLLGLGTGVGDAVKSFFKRRVGIAPGGTWLGFDQLDFMVGAYVAVLPVYAPPLPAFVPCLPIVMAGTILVTAVSYELGLKESWI